MKEYNPDVLIVGGGPAGSTAARILAENGIEVLVLERGEIGIPVQCAEYVSAEVTNLIDLKGLVSQPIKEMVTYLPNGEESRGKIDGFTIDRDRLDKRIAADAEKKGARFLLETEAVELDDGAVIAEKGKETIKLNPTIIIGADGPRSVVSTWMGSETTEFIVGLQWTLPLKEELKNNHIFFTPEIPGGYGWLFPKGNEANVGICIDLGVNKKLLALDGFVFNLIRKGFVEKEILRKTTGLIPVSGFKKVRQDNILLIGDAASLTDPMTGAGILNALRSGELAANSVSKAIKENDLEILSEFEKECETSFSSSLERSSAKRRYLDKFWDKDASKLSSAIKKSWFAFPEYYK